MIYPARADYAVEKVRRMESQPVSQAGRILLKKAVTEGHVGSGLEKDVFDYREGQVISFFTHVSIEPQKLAAALKTYYYAAKLGHLLLPNHIPDAHLAASRPAAIVFDKIYGEKDDITYEERHAFRRRLESIGITSACDLADGNLIRQSNGVIAYVDTINASMLVGNPELDVHIDTLASATARRARRLQLRLLAHSSEW